MNENDKLMLKIFLLAILAMSVWIYLLSFPWHWILYAVICMQVVAAFLVWVMENQAEKVQGASGWMLFSFICLNLYLAFTLGIFRAASNSAKNGLYHQF